MYVLFYRKRIRAGVYNTHLINRLYEQERRVTMKLNLYDNPVMKMLSKVADLIMLNFLFAIFCLPIVTIGASISAMYTITLKMVKGEEAYIFKGFLAAFKENFKQATIAWMILFPLGLMILYNFFLLENIQGQAMQNVIRVMMIFVTFIYVIIFTYVFPLIARYEAAKFKQTAQNALLIAVSRLPYTILMILVFAAPLAMLLIDEYTFAYSVMFGLVLGFSGVAYVNSILLRRVFKSVDAAREKLEAEAEAEDNK